MESTERPRMLRWLILPWAIGSTALLAILVETPEFLNAPDERSRLTVLAVVSAPYLVAGIALLVPSPRFAVGFATGVAQLMSALGLLLAVPTIVLPGGVAWGGPRTVSLAWLCLFVAGQLFYFIMAHRSRKAAGQSTDTYFGPGYLIGTLGPIVALLVGGALCGG